MSEEAAIEEAGRTATEAGGKTLVLPHFISGGLPNVSGQQRLDAVKPHFSGTSW